MLLRPSWLRRSNRRYNWDEFDPRLYREHNYVEIDPVDDEVLRDMASFYAKEKPSGRFLEWERDPICIRFLSHYHMRTY